VVAVTGNPVPFFGVVNDENIGALVAELEERAPNEDLVEVVFAGTGGSLSSALGFMTWMHAFPWKARVRAVATAEMATSAVMMFLAFERRTADSMASVSLMMPGGVDHAGAPAKSWDGLERLVAYSVITRTALTLADVRLRIDGGAPVIGEELWRSGFCNERATLADASEEGTEADAARVRDPDTSVPILFLDGVTFTSVRSLIEQMAARSDAGGTVVIATVGGTLAAAQGFSSWMRRFSARHKFLAVAGGLVGSAGVTLFGSFERRTADPWATVVFHDVAFERFPDDPKWCAYAAAMQELLHAWFRTRFGGNDKALGLLAESRLPLTGIGIRKLKILTEEPLEPTRTGDDVASPVGGRSEASGSTSDAATIRFEGTPDLAAVRGLAASLAELAPAHPSVRVEFSSRGSAEGVSVLDYLVCMGLVSWMLRFPWAANVTAVATGAIDMPTVVLFLAFDARSVADTGSLCLNAATDGAPLIDLRLALGEDATYEVDATANVRSHSVWALIALLLDRTRISSEQALSLNGDRAVLGREEAERLGFAAP
jgi:hypothetical protein